MLNISYNYRKAVLSVNLLFNTCTPVSILRGQKKPSELPHPLQKAPLVQYYLFTGGRKSLI